MTPAGWYGKIPGTGDFIARRVPSSFSEPWDRWLQAAIAGSHARLGARWRDTFLSMPLWRFVFSPGVVDASAWAGVMAPSVDAVGRYFPLALVSRLPAASLDIVATLFAGEPWFEEMEALALSAIAPGADPDTIDGAIARQGFRAEWLRYPESGDDTVPLPGARPQTVWVPLGERLAEPRAAWFAEESEVFGRCLAVCEALPAAEQYCAMMNGRWIEQGWARRYTRSGAAAA